MCLSAKTIHFNRRFFLHKMKPNPDNSVKILNKNITIQPKPQNHLDKMGKYISNDMFVSITASHSSQSREISLSGFLVIGKKWFWQNGGWL